MTAIVDTGFAYALAQPDDDEHIIARLFYLESLEALILPVPALTELSLLAHRDGGNFTAISMIQAIQHSRMIVTDLNSEDYDRAVEILVKYSDTRIDFVDTCVMALAERLKIARVLTFDRRDFGIYRPSHVKQFELLP